MLRPDLDYRPYKLQIVQELKEINFAIRWKDSCYWFLHLQLSEDTELFFIDEAHFELNGL